MEKDPDIRERIIAVHMRKSCDITERQTAIQMMRAPSWVAKWTTRYDEDGLEGLSTRPRSGAPPIIPMKTLEKIMSHPDNQDVTSDEMWEIIEEKTGIKYHMSYIRKLMRRFGMSAKKATFFHINRSSPDEIRAWQKSADSMIRYHKNRGHALLTEDESHHPYDVKPWQKNWGKIGRKSYIVYPANQKRISMHGILSDDGRQLFRRYNESTADIFIKFLKVAHKKFGDYVMLTDRAPVHTAKKVREFLCNNKGIKIIEYPVGCPDHNAMEACWKDGKQKSRIPRSGDTERRVAHRISEYYRTTKFNYSIMKFVMRRIEPKLSNFGS